MKRLLVMVILFVAIAGAYGEEVPIPFSGSLYLLSWYNVSHDGDLTRAYDATEFRYPGRISLRENGSCTIRFTSGIEQDYTWERHPEMTNVIVVTPDRGPSSYLTFAPVPENDIVAGSWAMSMVSTYTSSVQSQTYVVTQSE